MSRKPIEAIAVCDNPLIMKYCEEPEVRELEADYKKLELQIESIYEKTTATRVMEKDEYWGYWETCDSCKSSMISESVFCPNCGKRVTRQMKDVK